jgi:hypothetical protein
MVDHPVHSQSMSDATDICNRKFSAVIVEVNNPRFKISHNMAIADRAKAMLAEISNAGKNDNGRMA